MTPSQTRKLSLHSCSCTRGAVLLATVLVAAVGLIGRGLAFTAAIMASESRRSTEDSKVIGRSGSAELVEVAAVSSAQSQPSSGGRVLRSLAMLAASFAAATNGGLRGRRPMKKAPAKAATSKVAVEPFQPSAQVGVIEPLGYFDPLRFTEVGDEVDFRWLRSAELKHGRVAMLASLGAVGQPVLAHPWFQADGARGILGPMDSPNAQCGMLLLFLACGVMELAIWKDELDKEPGNFGDPLGMKIYTEEMRNKELSNGRMAMVCISGIAFAELATGKGALEQLTSVAELVTGKGGLELLTSVVM
mmetsp:Transcript_69894/g.167776  ORF Transcript_69894/g.167776 Transcript_69894/m.167776 type:complete len:304 (+) Transcript_69894:167-1078(+)